MKKMFLVFVMCFFAFGLIAQDHKNLLEDQRVEPPKFSGEMHEKEVQLEKSPICCFIEKELNYPDFRYGVPPEGVVGIEFTINPTGSLSNFKVTNPVDYQLEQAVISCIKKTEGMWIPGKVNGQQSSMEKSIYVKFDVKGNQSFIDISKHYYFCAIKKHQNGINTLNNNLLSTSKQQKKSERMFNSSLALLDKATSYLPNDATIEYWRAVNYKKLGMETEMIEALKKRQTLLSQQINGQNTFENYDLAIITRKK